MKRRWNANTWVLAVLAFLVAMIGVEACRQMLAENHQMAMQVKEQEDSMIDRHKPGEVGPDFTLPDSHKRKHSLSSLVANDTLVCFTCGCNNCRAFQTYLSEVLAKMGPNAPKVVTVTTARPEGEAEYRREVPLKHTILYDSPNHETPGRPIDEYQGHPCPRIYRMDAKRRIKWLSRSMEFMPSVMVAERDVAEELGFPEGKAPKIVTPDQIQYMEKKSSKAKPAWKTN
jgi:peroxiredoxin